MVGETSERHVEDGPGKRIPVLKIVLASRDLPDMSPGRGDVVHEWIVHPLRDLMPESLGVLDVALKDTHVAEGGLGIGLRSFRSLHGIVIAEDAAVGREPLIEEDIVGEEDREHVGLDLLVLEQLWNLHAVEPGNVNDSYRTAPRSALKDSMLLGHSDRDWSSDRRRPEQHMIIRRAAGDGRPEIGALEGVGVLRIADVGTPGLVVEVLKDRRIQNQGQR